MTALIVGVVVLGGAGLLDKLADVDPDLEALGRGMRARQALARTVDRIIEAMS